VFELTFGWNGRAIYLQADSIAGGFAIIRAFVIGTNAW
jgi:hypothetical protein